MGAEGSAGLEGTGLRRTNTTTMTASRMTALTMMMSAMGTRRLADVEAAGLGAGAGASATTGAGARLIMRVKSLGPFVEGGGAAPPKGESGVALPP